MSDSLTLRSDIPSDCLCSVEECGLFELVIANERGRETAERTVKERAQGMFKCLTLKRGAGRHLGLGEEHPLVWFASAIDNCPSKELFLLLATLAELFVPIERAKLEIAPDTCGEA